VLDLSNFSRCRIEAPKGRVWGGCPLPTGDRSGVGAVPENI